MPTSDGLPCLKQAYLIAVFNSQLKKHRGCEATVMAKLDVSVWLV